MDNTVQQYSSWNTGILQVRILERVAFPFSRGSSQPRDLTQVSHTAGRFFTSWARKEVLERLRNMTIFWTQEPGRLQSMGLQRVGHDWATKHTQHEYYLNNVSKVYESESESEVAQLCLTLCDPMDCSPPGSSVHGILQSRILEWVASVYITF